MKEDYKGYSEMDLVLMLEGGDYEAFTEIYERHWGILYIHAFKILHDEDDAKDIVQDVFINLWTKIDLSINYSLSAYLFKSVRNRVLNLIRQQRTKDKYIQSFTKYLAASDDAITGYVQEKDLARIIEKVISTMPEKMKEVFELSRKSGFSHRQIASKLGISEKTVKRQVSNALYILKASVSKAFNFLIFFFY